MTSDQYREILATKCCPHCETPFRKENMGMYGDINGYKLDDAGFPYTLWALCPGCKRQVTFSELNITERKYPPALARVIQFPAPK